VLYFAQYIVTHVDEAAKKRAADHLRQEMEAESARREKDLTDLLTTVESNRDEAVGTLKSRRECSCSNR